MQLDDVRRSSGVTGNHRDESRLLWLLFTSKLSSNSDVFRKNKSTSIPAPVDPDRSMGHSRIRVHLSCVRRMCHWLCFRVQKNLNHPSEIIWPKIWSVFINMILVATKALLCRPWFLLGFPHVSTILVASTSILTKPPFSLRQPSGEDGRQDAPGRRVHGNGKAAKSPKEWAFEWTTMYEICMKYVWNGLNVACSIPIFDVFHYQRVMGLIVYLVGALDHFYFSIYREFHHPNWRTHIFQRGRYTTNHHLCLMFPGPNLYLWDDYSQYMILITMESWDFSPVWVPDHFDFFVELHPKLPKSLEKWKAGSLDADCQTA